MVEGPLQGHAEVDVHEAVQKVEQGQAGHSEDQGHRGEDGPGPFRVLAHNLGVKDGAHQGLPGDGPKDPPLQQERGRPNEPQRQQHGQPHLPEARPAEELEAQGHHAEAQGEDEEAPDEGEALPVLFELRLKSGICRIALIRELAQRLILLLLDHALELFEAALGEQVLIWRPKPRAKSSSASLAGLPVGSAHVLALQRTVLAVVPQLCLKD
mmetsp:Transcript_2818/g.6764  ORF Transcript_2818/g.6764 Transcript_2818/m.6764 type:complete len:212 (+) Transcript_2818:1412-2047(+)